MGNKTANLINLLVGISDWPLWKAVSEPSDFTPENINLGQIIPILGIYHVEEGFPGGSVVKNLPTNAGGTGSIPGWGRCPGEGNGNPLQYSHLGNPMDRGAWRATVHGVTKSQTQPSD